MSSIVVPKDALQERLAEFIDFVKQRKGEAFESFKASPYMAQEENYKHAVYEQAHAAVTNADWTEDMVGTGQIMEAVKAAYPAKVTAGGQSIQNNLVNHFSRSKFAAQTDVAGVERALYRLFKAEEGEQGKEEDAASFAYFVNAKQGPDMVAYLFFIKDGERYLPVAQGKFDNAFPHIGLPNFKLTRNWSWDTYNEFVGIVAQVRDFLVEAGYDATMIDAHSFLYIVGNQMQRDEDAEAEAKGKPGDKAKKSGRKLQPNMPSFNAATRLRLPDDGPVDTTPLETYVAPVIPEEDFGRAFPQSMERFALHLGHERKARPVKEAKEEFVDNNPGVECQACGFSYERVYGAIGHNFIEAHHLTPLTQLKQGAQTHPDDFAMVCGNCHSMLQQSNPMMTVEELKEVIDNNRSGGNNDRREQGDD